MSPLNNYIFPAIFILLLCVNFSFAQHQPTHKKTKKHKTTATEPHHPSQHELHNVGSEYQQHQQHNEPQHQQNTPLEQQRQSQGYLSLSTKPKELIPGLNLKLSPAFYWKTIGAELEYVPTTHFSIGLNVYGKWGVTRPEKIDETTKYNFLSDGLRAALAFKYYIFNKAPEGLYVQANVAYTQLTYYNGSPIPYTLLNVGLHSGEIGVKPKPYSGGIGVGYQVIVIPNIIIANVMAGLQASVARDNKVFMSVYVAPSIGVIF